MRKIVAAIILCFNAISISHADHLFGGNIGNFTNGTLGNARIDNSSITKLGSVVDIAEIPGLDLALSTGQLKKSFRQATVYLATTSALPDSADVLSSASTGFTEALARIGAAGLTYSATAQGTIFIREGLYQWSGVTVPAGVSVWCIPGSSTVVQASTTSAIMTVYGKVYNLIFDAQDRILAGEFIQLKSGAVVDGVTIDGSGNADQNYNGLALFMLKDSTSVTLSATISSGAPCLQDQLGGGGLVSIVRSSDSWINLNVKNTTPGSTTGKQYIGVVGSRNVHLTGKYEGLGDRGIAILGGNTSVFIENADISLAHQYAAPIFVAADYLSNNSSCTIRNNLFRHSSTSNGTVLSFTGTTNSNVGFVVEGNRLIPFTSVSPTFATLSNRSNDTIIKDNVTYGSTFISDSGVRTQYTTLGNFNNSTQQ